MKSLHEQLTIVVLTHNRLAELRRTLRYMLALPDAPTVLVVDNASEDGTAARIPHDYPAAKLIRLDRNMGAAARNVGVREANTPYIAFCDDDTWWEAAGLAQAVATFEAYSSIAVLNARVLVGAQALEDPTCACMAQSSLPSLGLPGPALLGFLAGACVIRKEAFIKAGGYEPKFFIGGEEALLALDLIADGWHLVYMPKLVVHHYPSGTRDSARREHLLVRNALWVAWLRLPFFMALRQTARICKSSSTQVVSAALINALREIPWILRRRRVLPRRVLALYEMLEGQ